MVGAPVLNQPLKVLIAQQNPIIKAQEIDFNLKEQECVSLIKTCKNMLEFKKVHGQILKLGFFWSPFVASNLVATCALAEWGSMDYACSIFQKIENPSSFEFNAMIRGYTKDMNSKEAILIYLDMLEVGVEPDNFTYPPLLKACSVLSTAEEGKQIHGHILKFGLFEDVFVQNSLISMYGKCGLLGNSCDVFSKMDFKTVASWSALIAAHANSGMWAECLRLFSNMIGEGSWRAEESTLVNVISASAHLGTLDFGKCTHTYLLRNLSGLNVAVETSLMDMYLRCGSLDKGMSLFREMGPRKNRKSYSVMISGLASHGQGEKALVIFERMLENGLKPDDVTYVGVLSACSHAGLVETGLKYFDRMKFEHKINPTMQHYGCMVDLMGRAGLVHEALELIKAMPMEPNDVIWRSLLSSCKVHKNLEVGKLSAEKLFELNTQNAGDYVMMSNIYAQDQRWQDVASIRVKLANDGLNQVVGWSSVEVKGKIHKFVSNDKSHSDFREIYEMIHQMEWQLKFEGYSPDTSQVLLDVGGEEKRERLSLHSQKLAIAFSLIRVSEGSRIRIVRNVRMCSDCHTYTKLISVIYGREIVVRERNVFHCFRDGACSCKDFW
ncbi:Pentatricopeptide repeat-containing protein [Striga hermonthica]|uniref:Pentatricopeptide repeat-containing protein n=1 Tax=Striga hermonthica TaxID=68872 RepID=A0A9N7R3P7_STRHE|nr:Pentatricopeptide repeat-containing protein [Striga hermonthica]